MPQKPSKSGLIISTATDYKPRSLFLIPFQILARRTDAGSFCIVISLASGPFADCTAEIVFPFAPFGWDSFADDVVSSHAR
jgi:hypothetical protein